MKLPAVINAATTATTNTTPINPMSKTCDFLCHAFFQICQIVMYRSYYCCVHHHQEPQYHSKQIQEAISFYGYQE